MSTYRAPFSSRAPENGTCVRPFFTASRRKDKTTRFSPISLEPLTDSFSHRRRDKHAKLGHAVLRKAHIPCVAFMAMFNASVCRQHTKNGQRLPSDRRRGRRWRRRKTAGGLLKWLKRDCHISLTSLTRLRPKLTSGWWWWWWFLEDFWYRKSRRLLHFHVTSEKFTSTGVVKVPKPDWLGDWLLWAQPGYPLGGASNVSSQIRRCMKKCLEEYVGTFLKMQF